MIPRFIHQTWRDADVPPSLRAYADTWRRHHPDWGYRLWTDADLAELVETRFPALAATFHGYAQGIMRADLGRYLVLKEHGGVYADLDAEALRPWDGLTDAGRPVLFEEPASQASQEKVRRRGFSRLVSNAVIATPAGHPFWDHLLALLQRCRSARDPLDATGPFVLTAAVESAAPDAAPQLLPAHLAARLDNRGVPVPVPPDTGEGAAPLADHHWAGTWWRDGAEWPPGYFDAPPRDEGWLDRRRERRAAARLAATLTAAASIPPHRDPPRGIRLLVAIPALEGQGSLAPLLRALAALDHPADAIALAVIASTPGAARRLKAEIRAFAGRFARVVVRCRRIFPPREKAGRESPAERLRLARLARARNRLLETSLRDEDWVLWLEPGVTALPRGLVRDLIATDAPLVQPNVVGEPGGPSIDLRGWLAERTLDDDSARPYWHDGLYLPPAGYARLYPSDLRYRERMPLDAIGGQAVLVAADLHRAGVRFPETPYRGLVDTEGFGALLRDRGLVIAGLPNVEVVAADAPAQPPRGLDPSPDSGDQKRRTAGP